MTTSDTDTKDPTPESSDETAADKVPEGEAAAASSSSSEKASSAPKRTATKKAGSGGSRTATARTARKVPAKRKGSTATSVVLFVVIVGALIAGIVVFGSEKGGTAGPAAPKWRTGQEVELEITLVPTDQKELACASGETIEGRHCQFEDKQKAWSKGGDSDDKNLLKPYTTTNQVQFVAAGLWSDPGMTKAKLPATRFTVKCKYKVEGKIKKPSVRWNSEGPWYDRQEDWYSGLVSGCSILP